MKHHYETIEALLLHKDVDQLTAAEKKMVQTLMSITDYQQQRNVLITSKSILAQKPPRPINDLSMLQARFQAQKNNSWLIYLSKPIAAYQTVLFACVVGILVWWFRPTEIKTQIQQEIVYVPKVDTIVEEKIIIQEKIVYKTQTITLPALPADTVFIPLIDQKLFYKDKENKQIFAKNKPKGKSMKDMGDLMHFVVGAD